MLTGQADLEAAQKAVNNGEIYRFILKPWQDEDLKACVAAAVEMHSTLIGERKQKEIALKQNEQLVASNAPLEVQVANRSDPVVGTEIFRSIMYFDPICAIIGAHHERFDGSGFPNGEEGKNIATPAYIVGLADEYDHLMNRPSSNAEFRYQYACERIAEYSDKLFPAEVVQACLDYAASVNDHQMSVDQMKIGLIDLAPNLTLCRDIYTMSGCLLMAKGATLTGKNIARIRAIAKLDPVTGDIYVSRNREKELQRL